MKANQEITFDARRNTRAMLRKVAAVLLAAALSGCGGEDPALGEARSAVAQIYPPVCPSTASPGGCEGDDCPLGSVVPGQSIAAPGEPCCGDRQIFTSTTIGRNEQCEIGNLNGQTCRSLGFSGGTLLCRGCLFDTAGCYKCGDGVRSSAEPCEGTNLGGETCVGLGFLGGTLSCTASCTFNTSGCYKCGDGKKNGSDECDGADFGTRTCASYGFNSGSLKCTSACAIDAAACYNCGDGIKGTYEQCDGSDLGGATCGSLGYAGGTLRCGPGCKLSTKGCFSTKWGTLVPTTQMQLRRVATDSSGNVYVLEEVPSSPDSKVITKINATGTVVGKVSLTIARDSRVEDFIVDEKGGMYFVGQNYIVVQGAYPGGQPAGYLQSFLYMYGPAGQYLWSVTGMNTGWGENSLTRLARDPATGAIYAGGWRAGTEVSLWSSVSGEGPTLPGSSQPTYQSIYLLKVDTTGKLVWAKASDQSVALTGGIPWSSIGQIAVDGSGVPYVVGDFGWVLLYGGATLTSSGKQDGFLMTLSPSTGSVTSTLTIGGAGADRCSSVAFGSGSAVYLAGSISGQASVLGKTLSSGGASDAFVLRLHRSGSTYSLSKAATLGCASSGDVRGLVVDSQSSVYVAGDVGGALARLDAHFDKVGVLAERTTVRSLTPAFDSLGTLRLVGTMHAATNLGGVTKTPSDTQSFVWALSAPELGADGQACLMNGTCFSGFACVAKTDTCVTAGNIGQPCLQSGACNTGVCRSGMCVAAGGAGQPCYSDGSCNSGLICNTYDKCAAPTAPAL